MWEVKVALEKCVVVPNTNLFVTITFMKRKFNRYWKLMWLQISFPVILDPQFKFEFIEFRLRQAFESEADIKIAALRRVLSLLCKDYSQVIHYGQDMPPSAAATSEIDRYSDWDQHLSNSTSSTSLPSELELEIYLAKTRIPRRKSFDTLAWWKSNSSEYPTLSRMAQDALAIQASTVASESAFSTGMKLISEWLLVHLSSP
jgi:hypothetical protein